MLGLKLTGLPDQEVLLPSPPWHDLWVMEGGINV